MRLPPRIEHELRELESYLAATTRQQAGSPRLRAIRSAIEEFMRDNNLKWDTKSNG